MGIARRFDKENGVLHDKSPHGHAGKVEQDTRKEHGDDARYPAKHAQTPTLGHDSQADLVTRKQPGRLLPRHGAKLDIVTVVLSHERSKCDIFLVRIDDGRIDQLFGSFLVGILGFGHGWER